jgi:hypothetical protein
MAARVIDHRPAMLRPLAEVSAGSSPSCALRKAHSCWHRKGSHHQGTGQRRRSQPELAAFRWLDASLGRASDAAGSQGGVPGECGKLPAYTGFAWS